MAAAKNQLSPELYRDIRKARWKCRTDLGYLCRVVLNYPDVSDSNGGPWHAIHQPLIDKVQHFPRPTAAQFEVNDVLLNGKWSYEPLVPIIDLKGKRRRLVLDSRSFLKTTINSIAHTIQWIINYPDIAIMLMMAADERAKLVLGEIKGHFQYNKRFRELFPEHCPQRRLDDFGTANAFTTEARKNKGVPKEPTVMTGSIEKGAAGLHFHVVKFSDIVDEKNISGTGLEAVRKGFDISHNLLINPRYWIDVEGTRYHFADTYGKIIDRELVKPIEEREYEMFIRGVFIKKDETYTPEDYKKPYALDDKGKRISRWPENFPLNLLESKEKDDPWIFSCQMLNSPAMNVEGAAPFPVNERFPKTITREDFNNNVRVAYKEICVDFASTNNDRSNFTCITVGTIDHRGRLYIEEIKWGKWLANQAIDNLFAVAQKHSRHLRHITIEESEYQRGLMPTIERKMEFYRNAGYNFNFNYIKRGNRQAKNDRIYKALQPWYAGIVIDNKGSREVSLRFLEDIDELAWKHLIKELEEFPASESDDIMDTLADFLTGKEYFGREVVRAIPGVLPRDESGMVIHGTPEVNRIFKAVQNREIDRLYDLQNPFSDEYEVSKKIISYI